jgi:tetratricopeptide (TPR) repeat protein
MVGLNFYLSRSRNWGIISGRYSSRANNIINQFYGKELNMRKRIISILVFFVIFPLASSAQCENPSAILLSYTGEVIVNRSGGESVEASYGLALFAGDEIKTGPDSSAEIHFENGSWIEVGANSSLQVKQQGKKKQKTDKNTGPKSFAKVANFMKLKDSEGTSTLAALRSVEKKQQLLLESPSQTKIRDRHPVFRWKASGQAGELLLTIYNEDGIHWKHKVQGAGDIAYPKDAPSLVPGTTYSWTVETTDPLTFPPLRSKAAFFEVLSEEEEKELATLLEEINKGKTTSESAYHIVRASLFFDFSLIDEAIAETKDALDTDPGNATLRSILARLYTEAGRTEEALEEYNELLDKQ